MKCSKCDGTGKEYWNGNVFCNTGFECDKCNGTGEIEMTNNEWRKTCSAEEFAEFLCNVGFENETIVRKFKSEWMEWLKEIHNAK